MLVWSVVGGGGGGNQCLESMANTIKPNKPETSYNRGGGGGGDW